MRTGKFVLGAALLTLATSVLAAPPSRDLLIHYLDAKAAGYLAARAATIAGIDTEAGARRRQAQVRAGLIASLGGLPDDHAPLAAKSLGRVAGDGFHIEKILYDSMKDQHITALLFLPDGAGPFPAVIVTPGHAPNGKTSDYAFSASLARAGIAVLSYDPVGEGERLEYYDPLIGESRALRPTGDHSVAAYQTLMLGDHVARYFVHDAMRGVDYLASRPEVDKTRIGAFGCSGGGTVTAYLAALDPRIRAAGVACYVNDYAHLLAGPGNQEAEQSIPGFLADGFDIPDWVELAAPRPYAVISTTEDMFPYAGAKAAVEEARRWWGLYGAGGKFEWIVGPGRHGNLGPIGGKIVDFFVRALQARGPAGYAPARPERPEDLRVTPTGQLVTSLGGQTIAGLNRDRARQIAATPAAPDNQTGLAALRTRLRDAIRTIAHIHAIPGAKPQAAVAAEASRGGIAFSTLTFPSPAGPLEARLARRPDASRILLLLDTAPLERLAAPNGRMERLAAQGWAVLALQARGMDGGEEAKAPINGDQNLLSLRAYLVGETPVGLRIDDCIRAVDWLAAAMPGLPVTLDGVGAQGPVALHAALLDDRIAAVRLEDSQLSWRAAIDLPLQRDLPAIALPGALKTYDLPDLITALSPRPVAIVAPVDPLGVPLDTAGFDTEIAPALASEKRLGASHIRLLAYPDQGLE